MALRSYANLSDEGPVEMLNGNLHRHMFYGVLIALSHPIRDSISAIRSRLASIPIKELQRVVLDSWKGEFRHVERCDIRPIVRGKKTNVSNSAPRSTTYRSTASPSSDTIPLRRSKESGWNRPSPVKRNLPAWSQGCRHGHHLCKQRKPYLLHESRYRDFPLHARNRIPRRTGHGTCGVSLGTYESPLWRDKLLWPSNIGLCHLSLLLYQLKHSILAKNGENAALTKIKGAKWPSRSGLIQIYTSHGMNLCIKCKIGNSNPSLSGGGLSYHD